MKKDLHSDYHEITVVMTDGAGSKTRSTSGSAGDTLKLDIDPSTPWTGVHRLVDSGGRLARSSKRFENFALTGRGVQTFLESQSEGASRMLVSLLRPRTLRTIAPAASTRADCAGRQAMPPNQFRAGECRAGTRSLIVRACAAVVLAACLVSGLATGVRDAAAVVEEVVNDGNLDFGSAAGDADVAGTVVLSPAQAKTVTGGAFDFGGGVEAVLFVIITTNDNDPYSCTVPTFQVFSGTDSMTVDTFTADFPFSGNMPGTPELEMSIGATVHLAAGQAAGNYSGTITMTCDGFSDSGMVSIALLAPISISSSADLDFGTMLTTGNPGGTVIVTPAGGRTCSLQVDCFGGFPSAAAFDVTGASGQAYVITFSPATLTGPAPGPDMTVDTFTDDATLTLVGGSDTFNVGATLHVGGAQAAGTYSGTFTVTVSYN